jgi:hypothetical protein
VDKLALSGSRDFDSPYLDGIGGASKKLSPCGRQPLADQPGGQIRREPVCAEEALGAAVRAGRKQGQGQTALPLLSLATNSLNESRHRDQGRVHVCGLNWFDLKIVSKNVRAG